MTTRTRNTFAIWGVGAWAIGYGTGKDGPWWLILAGCLLLMWATLRLDRQ